jgi:hypothetical protein
MFWLISHLKHYLRKEYEAWLLSEILPLTTSGKIKGSSASKCAEWVLVTWKNITGKTVSCYSRNGALQMHLMAQRDFMG